MTTGILVIVGYWGIGIERCWKRLFDGGWYSWKSNFVEFFEALFKMNNWSFDLKSVVHWFGLDTGPSLVLERHTGELLSEDVVLRYRVLRRHSTRSLYFPVCTRRFLFDH